MITYSDEQLREVLQKHLRWSTGKGGGQRANLRNANLSRVYLSGADLRGADLSEANLQGADLSGADLKEANLRDADLQGATLRGANLRYANLRGADLRNANLREADLEGADLRGANLQGANLREANLWRADLRRADLEGADLRNCSLANNRNPFLLGNFSVGQHLAVATTEYLAIGCEQHPYSYWLENFETIGRQNDYTEEEIRRYGLLINLYYSFSR